MRSCKPVSERASGHTPEQPQDLVGIIYHVDGRMKITLLYDELARRLQRLIENGRIAELPRHKFYEVTDGSAPRTFSGLTREEQSQAEEAYRKRFWIEYRKLNQK